MSELNGSASTTKREMIAELKAMNRIERILREVPASALGRVGKWTAEYAADLATAKYLEGDDDDLPCVPNDDPKF